MNGVLAGPGARRRGTLVALCCAGAILFSAISLAAPSRADALWWENDKITATGDFPGVLITVDKDDTGKLLILWRGPWCDRDFNGNSIPGGPMDRAVCLLNTFRAFCPSGWWPPQNIVAGYICGEATHYREWRDVDAALWTLLGPQPAAPDCLALHVFSSVEGPWNWTSRNISTAECESQ
jgi:hypothetical protein